MPDIRLILLDRIIHICLYLFGDLPFCFYFYAVRTVLLAIIGFMPTKGEGAIGSLDYTPQERKALAKRLVVLLDDICCIFAYHNRGFTQCATNLLCAGYDSHGCNLRRIFVCTCTGKSKKKLH